MTTPAVRMVNDFRERQMSEAMAQAARFAQWPAPEAQTVFPSNSNDEALQASVNELKERDVEYKRLASDEARKEWEGTARANLIRNQELTAQREDRIALDQAQEQAVSDQRVTKLLQHAQELQASLPNDKPMTEWNMPTETLRDVATTMQELDREAKKRGLPGMDFAQSQPVADQRHPETFEDGSKVKIIQNADGTVEARLVTGEIFRGDPLEVTRKIGEASVNTKRWARQIKANAQQAQPANGNATAMSPDTNGAALVDFSKIPDVTKWNLDQIATAFGYSDGQELVNDQIAQREKTQRLEQEVAEQREARQVEEVASDFQMRNPDFPNSEEAIEKLSEIMDKNGLDWSADNLSMAHVYAVKHGVYRPLTADDMAAGLQAGVGISSQTQRRVAPPQPPPNAAIDNRGGQQNEWNMPLDELRKNVLQAQRSGQVPTLMSR